MRCITMWIALIGAVGAAAMLLLTVTHPVISQTVPSDATPLTIAKQGSFFVGGREAKSDSLALTKGFAPSGTIAVDLMGMALAAAGLLGPGLAALIHVGSETAFILNSARLIPGHRRR